MTTIFERLRLDHDDQRSLLARLAETEGDSAERRELWRRLREELEAHAAIEERVFYSELLGEKLTRGKAAHSVGEHEEQRSALAALAEVELSSPGWKRKLSDLRHEVEHHLEEEEQEIFQLAGKVLGEEQKAEMARRFEKEKAARVAS